MWRKTLICLAIMGILLLVCSGYRIHMRGPPRDEEAKRLRDELTLLHDLDHLPEGVDLFRFPDDTWVMGVGIDSHSMRQAGGTLALRDSRGNVQVFVGHVCGPGWMGNQVPFQQATTLDEFYKALVKMRFEKYGGDEDLE
jgi:hypothetical protein